MTPEMWASIGDASESVVRLAITLIFVMECWRGGLGKWSKRVLYGALPFAIAATAIHWILP